MVYRQKGLGTISSVTIIVASCWLLVARKKNLKIHKTMLLTKYDLHASLFFSRKERTQATSDKQRATDFNC